MTREQRSWHVKKCAEYKHEYPTYKIYASTLESILKAICRTAAPLAIVQSRPKAVASFAEKMARKAAQYIAENTSPTDLCGARVIAETQAEVDRVCALIRATLTIDEANSPDIRTRLNLTEFGYLSVHYVIQLPPAGTILGVPIPAEIGERKAEIQVRTLLQHAWADISHDRIYKSSFKVPANLKRDLARVAAFLEEADSRFGAAIRAIDNYKLHYGAYMNAERLKEEIDILKTVIDNEDEKSRAALRLAAIYRSTADWTAVASILAPFLSLEDPEILAEHGHALCHQPKLFQNGLQQIEQALPLAQGDLRTRILAYRAWASSRLPNNERETRDFYRAAYQAAPTNPFHMAAYVEYEIFCGEPLGFLSSVMQPVFLQAIRTCRAYIDAGIELPPAFLTIGRFNLLLGRYGESLAAYAAAIPLCLPIKGALEAEVLFVDRINRAKQPPEEHAWVRDLLLLALNHPSKPAKQTPYKNPVVILAGSTSTTPQKLIDDNLLRAFKGFTGAIISGGTPVGIPGIAGQLGKTIPAEIIGYLPQDKTAEPHYTELLRTSNADFSFREPLQYWTDLLAAGISPTEVKLLGVDGGPIAAFEYRIALALGATVAVLEPATRAAADLAKDPDWNTHPKLLRLPNDAMTLRAFVNPPQPVLTPEQVESAAERIHADFLQTNRYKNPDAAMQPWSALRDDLKESNRMQAKRAIGFLTAAGLTVVRKSGKIPLPKLTPKQIDLMAEMEHGRWVVERAQSGWQYGPERDPTNKRSPYLAPWNQLTPQIKGYDREAVKLWPKVLAEAGLAVFPNKK